MMLHLWNTLTKKKEEFKPIKNGEVSMYNCGPTVYNYAHIGNLRAYVFADILRRTLSYNGYKVKQVMNITDIGHLTSDADFGDDKMVKALKRENKPMTLEGLREIAQKYTNLFIEDLKDLHIQLPHITPFASDHIKEDIELIQKLEEKGFAYKIEDGIYFDISKFPEYGKLGQIDLEGQKAGVRVEVNSGKRNAFDFSLWKFSKDDLGWDSPWGKGFPGWHIECSAMSRKYLGQPFDIHTGGIDHIPVHHNNEIAQSEAAFNTPLANYWMHNAHLHMGSEKMAKSGENFLTLKKLQDDYKISPITYRFWLLTSHYRKGIDFSPKAILASEVFYKKIAAFYLSLSEIRSGAVDPEFQKKFKTAVNDDLNTAEALALIPELISSETLSKEDKKATLENFDEILGLDLKNQREKTVLIPPEIEKLKTERELARKNKDWKKSDELRKQIEASGFIVKDTETGQELFQK